MTSNSPPRPLLTIPRAEAKQRLEARIPLAKEIAPGRIKTADELESAESRQAKWTALNLELLSRIFTADEYASEYAASVIPVHVPSDRYYDVSLADLERRLNRSVAQQVVCLESVTERLELIPEAGRPAQHDGGSPATREVFVVHGHDEAAREEVARLIAKCGLTPIILHEQASGVRTVIEKLERYSNVSFVVVLLTPDDVGGPAPENVAGVGRLRPRARQNVIAELFYFIGKLGRDKVCALKKGEIEIPSDIGGVVYNPMDAGGGWKTTLLRELEAAGHEIDWRKALG